MVPYGIFGDIPDLNWAIRIFFDIRLNGFNSSIHLNRGNHDARKRVPSSYGGLI